MRFGAAELLQLRGVHNFVPDVHIHGDRGVPYRHPEPREPGEPERDGEVELDGTGGIADFLHSFSLLCFLGLQGV